MCKTRSRKRGFYKMWYDEARDIVVYSRGAVGDNCAALRNINGEYSYTRCTLDNLQALRRAGLDVPPIMNLKYDWPRNRRFVSKPFAAQVVTANHAALHPRSFILNDMRTGKTLSTLWAADFIMGQAEAEGRRLRGLIVCPLSTIRSVWLDAISTHFMGRRKALNVHHSSAKRRVELLMKDVDFYVINIDGVKIGAKKGFRGVQFEKGGLAEALRDRKDIDIFIFDEASAFRDAQSVRSAAAREVCRAKTYVWALTGTPTPNAPTDAHGLRKLLDPNYTESFKMVKERMMYHGGGFKWWPKGDGYLQAAALLTPAVRFKKEHCFDMPPQLQTYRDAEFSKEQAQLYEELRLSMRAELAGGDIDAVHEGALRLKLLQIACGAVYDAGHTAHELDCKPRIDVLKEALLEADCGPKGQGKVLIFAPFTSIVSMLNSKLNAWWASEQGAASAIKVIAGATHPKSRATILSNFQNEKYPRIIIADPRTMAHGVCATAANTIIWYAPCDQPESWAQGNERILGASQKNTTLVVKIAITKVEREIYERLNNKQNMQGVMLSMLEDNRG